MIDIRLIREQTDFVREGIAKLFTEAPIDEILAADEKRRALVTEVEALKMQRNEGSKVVSKTKDPSERQRLITEMRELRRPHLGTR